MRKSFRNYIAGIFGTAILIALMCLVNNAASQPPPKEESPEPAPPAGQTYTGSKACSACHFKQFMSWKKTKHAKEEAWKSMPEKYHTNAECLQCHTTGYGQPGGFKDAASSSTLVGTTCEACHGPGSEHEKVCKPLLNKKTLTPEEQKIARDAIYKIMPKNVCIQCHQVIGHIDHPKYDK